MKTITVKCSKGKVNIKTSGFPGKECMAATAKLKSDLGLVVESEEKTAEYFGRVEEDVHAKH